jgi:hypothetical protein
MVVVGEVVGGAVGSVGSGGAVVGAGWVATGAESGGGVAVVTGVVVGSELDGGATEVGRVLAGAESADGGPGGSGRVVAVAAGVDAGSPVVVELGTATSANTVAGSVVVDTSGSWTAVVGTAAVGDVVVAFVIVQAVVVIGPASDLGMGVSASPDPPELGPCHTAARTKRTTSSTETTTRASVLADGRSSAFGGCGGSLTSMH